MEDQNVDREPPPTEGWPTASAEASGEGWKAGVGSLGSESIYDGARLAQPDEVWNYQTGDGLEKAILLANVWRARHSSKSDGGKPRHPNGEIKLSIQPENVELKLGEHTLTFESSKGLTKEIRL